MLFVYLSSRSRPSNLAVTFTARTGGLKSKLYSTNFLLFILIFRTLTKPTQKWRCSQRIAWDTILKCVHAIYRRSIRIKVVSKSFYYHFVFCLNFYFFIIDRSEWMASALVLVCLCYLSIERKKNSNNFWQRTHTQTCGWSHLQAERFFIRVFYEYKHNKKENVYSKINCHRRLVIWYLSQGILKLNAESEGMKQFWYSILFLMIYYLLVYMLADQKLLYRARCIKCCIII